MYSGRVPLSEYNIAAGRISRTSSSLSPLADQNKKLNNVWPALIAKSPKVFLYRKEKNLFSPDMIRDALPWCVSYLWFYWPCGLTSLWTEQTRLYLTTDTLTLKWIAVSYYHGGFKYSLTFQSDSLLSYIYLAWGWSLDTVEELHPLWVNIQAEKDVQ